MISPPMNSVKVPTKAVSIWQPWASLYASGLKRYETRSWHTKHLGPLAIHASKHTDPAIRAMAKDETFRSLVEKLPPLHLGAIVGVVYVIGCLPTSMPNNPSRTSNWVIGLSEVERALGDFSPGRFGWVADRAMIFDDPIPCVGRQGVFNLEPETIAAISRSMSSKEEAA